MWSRAFLDAPFPEHLPGVGACLSCNNGFSADEEYLACLVEAAVAGTTDPKAMRRPSVQRAFARSVKLRARLEAARYEEAGKTWFAPEQARVLNVVVKLARGHAAFELSQPCREQPASVLCRPLITMSGQEREEFEEPYFPEILPEVGSRASRRLMVIQPTLAGFGASVPVPGLMLQDWQEVQKDRYSYLATDDGAEIRVRILIGGYLACDVRWGKAVEAS